MQVSETKDEAACDRENRDFELDCKVDSANFYERTRERTKDLDKTYTLWWGCCQLNLRERIECQTGFEEIIRNVPIYLLLVIKKHALDY